MAATNILTTGNSETSAEFTVADGTVALIGLKGMVAGARSARIIIESKDDQNNFNYVGYLGGGENSKTLPAGTYRAKRPGGVTVGVYRG